MHFTRPPAIITLLTKDLLWSVKSATNQVYLTFDDGPTPGITDGVLELLEKYNAKSTFFCLGCQVKKYPELYAKIISLGHRTGNHTYSHPSGWRTGNYSYYRDVMQCQELVPSALFRPPYGRISIKQMITLKKKYRIVMWDVLSGDYDDGISTAQCIKNVLDHVRPGSIIVFHDNDKAGRKMLEVIPVILEQLQRRNFVFTHL